MNNKYLKYIYGIIIFYVIWLVCIPLGFRFIADTFSNKINEICIIKPRLYTSIFPNIKLKAEEIKILNKDSTLALKITEPKVNVRILPLILARVHINSLESKNITAKLYLKDKLYLGDYPIELPKSNNNIKLDRLKISDVTLNLCQNTDKHIFNGKNIYYKTKGKSLIFHMTSDLISDNVTSGAYFDVNLPNNKNYKKYKFNVDICELNINPLSRLIQYYTKDISGYETENMEGIINLHSDNKKMYAGLNGLKIFFSMKKILIPK